MRKMKKKQDNQENEQQNPSSDDQENDSEDKKDQNKVEETEASLDSDYDIDEYKLDEQLVDTESDKQSNEQVIQKKNITNLNLDYNIFANQYDEIIEDKAKFVEQNHSKATFAKKIESSSPFPVKWDINGTKRDIDKVSSATLSSDRNNKK